MATSQINFSLTRHFVPTTPTLTYIYIYVSGIILWLKQGLLHLQGGGGNGETTQKCCKLRAILGFALNVGSNTDDLLEEGLFVFVFQELISSVGCYSKLRKIALCVIANQEKWKGNKKVSNKFGVTFEVETFNPRRIIRN